MRFSIVTLFVVCLFVCLQLNAQLIAARKDLKHAQTIMQLDELKSRKRVLRRYRIITQFFHTLIAK